MIFTKKQMALLVGYDAVLISLMLFFLLPVTQWASATFLVATLAVLLINVLSTRAQVNYETN